ncbi:MAG: hypothetical protein MJE68_11015, partial [Proteobacteria bacterium]|nr:hypothetical protein [Pseudomonadota bacterium]
HTILYAFAYLVGPLLMVYFHRKYVLISYRLLHFTIGFQLVIVLVQYSGLGFLQSWLAVILDPLFIGYKPSALTELGRGVSGSFVEPSHLSRYAILYMVLSLYLFNRSPVGKVHKYTLIFLALSLLIASQAITGILVLLIIGGLFLFKSLIARKIKPSFQILLLGSVLIIGVLAAESGSRFSAIGEKFEILVNFEDDFSVLDLENFGGIRLVNTVIGLKSITIYPFGQGIGSAPHTILDTSYQLNIPLLETNLYRRIQSGDTESKGSIKPQGIGAQYIYDFGIFGLICACLLAVPIIRSFFKSRNTDVVSVAPLAGLLLVLFYSTTTFPMPWLLMALIFQPDKRSESL